MVVKPHRTNELPLDVVAYADGDPCFPQQDTSDQFFDEAQWESYHNLGLILGGVVNDRLLGFAREWGQIRDAARHFQNGGGQAADAGRSRGAAPAARGADGAHTPWAPASA